MTPSRVGRFKRTAVVSTAGCTCGTRRAGRRPLCAGEVIRVAYRDVPHGLTERKAGANRRPRLGRRGEPIPAERPPTARQLTRARESNAHTLPRDARTMPRRVGSDQVCGGEGERAGQAETREREVSRHQRAGLRRQLDRHLGDAPLGREHGIRRQRHRGWGRRGLSRRPRARDATARSTSEHAVR